MAEATQIARPLKVGMAVYGDLTFDSRVRREAATLAEAGFDVNLVCLDGPGPRGDLPDGVRVVVQRPTRTATLPGSSAAAAPRRGLRRALGQLSWLRDYVANLRAWGRAVPTICPDADVWHLHDLTTLAGVLPALPAGTPVVYDAHELFLESGSAAMLPGPVRRLLRRYEQRLVKRVSAIVTVNDELAAILRHRYGPRRMAVVHNCPRRWTPPDRRPTQIRDAAGIPADCPIVLYHGGLGGQRGIEQLMEAMLRPGLENAHLVLLGPGYLRDTYVEASRAERYAGRVHVLDPVPPDELLPWVASADIGALPIQRSTLNHWLATPNKLFECLAAGIPVVASDFPAIRRIVVDSAAGPVGVLCEPASVDAIADALRSLLALDPAADAEIRRRCLTAASERWNWEHETIALLGLYRDLASAPAQPVRQRK
jgi:glycosyltransferase involved in cell wall biosynthesis